MCIMYIVDLLAARSVFEYTHRHSLTHTLTHTRAYFGAISYAEVTTLAISFMARNYPSIDLQYSTYLPVCPSIHLSVCPSVCPSV